MASNPIDGFQVDPTDIQFIGKDLQRPECILAKRSGDLWAADARGGVVKITPDGRQDIITQHFGETFSRAQNATTQYTEGTLPNGLAFAKNGNIYISNFGTDVLEVMEPNGKTTVLYDEIDGEPIGKVNFILRDTKERLWLTVSTRIKNWMEAISPNVSDGFIAMADDKGLRIMTDGLSFTNEIRFDANEEYLYIVETCGQRISRMKVAEDGTLSQREVFGPTQLGSGGFPDGIAFDSHGNLWGTLVMSDQIFAITPEGDYRIILDDRVAETEQALEKAFRADAVTPDHMLAAGGTIANWFASVTFGGHDLKTVYIGSLRGTRIPYFKSPVAGLAMAHWAE